MWRPCPRVIAEVCMGGCPGAADGSGGQPRSLLISVRVITECYLLDLSHRWLLKGHAFVIAGEPPLKDTFAPCDFSSPLCGGAGGTFPQTGGRHPPPCQFSRMSYGLIRALCREGCDGRSRDPWPVPLCFPRSLNNSTGPHMVFIFQGTKCWAGTILFILSVSPSAGEPLSLSKAFSSRASSPKVQVAHQSCAVCGCPRGHRPEIWVAGGSAFSEKHQWPPVSL